MLITVRLFAGAAQLAGLPEISLNFDQAGVAPTVGAVAEQLAKRFPHLHSLVVASRWAVGDEFVAMDFAIGTERTLVLIPPVSGG